MDFFKLLRISEQNYYCAIVGSETIERKRQECNMDRTSLQKGGLYRYTDLCMHNCIDYPSDYAAHIAITLDEASSHLRQTEEYCSLLV